MRRYKLYIVLGGCVVPSLTLNTSGSTHVCEVTLRRRSLFSGTLQAVLGINVITLSSERVPGAVVSLNSNVVGITGGSDFGTAGYLKMFSTSGDLIVNAVSDTLGISGSAITTFIALGINNIDLVLDTDIQSPTIQDFKINNNDDTTHEYAINIGITATDNVGISSYYLSESSDIPSLDAVEWVSISPTSSLEVTVTHNLSGGLGLKTLYLWVRDEAGNISNSVTDSITVSLASLVAHYELNDTANDSSGNEIHGTVVGDASFDTSLGRTGLNIHNNKNNYILIDNPTLNDTSWGTTLTVSAWVKLSGYTTYSIIVSNGIEIGSQYGFFLSADGRYHGDPFSGQFFVGVDNKDQYLLLSEPKAEEEIMQLEQWYHVAGVYNGVTMKYYLNGAQLWTKTLEPEDQGLSVRNGSSHTMKLGGSVRHPDWPDNHLNGMIDDVRIYNRDLSANEILDLYNYTQ